MTRSAPSTAAPQAALPTALRAALDAAGVEAALEMDGRLVVVVPRTMAQAAEAMRRRASLVAAARADGYTHCAVSLPSAP